MPPAAASPATAPVKKTTVPEKKYKCQFCSRAFSRSEHRSRHERSHTKERPFKCMKCRSTFVRRDLLLRHDRTVHAKDGGVPLVSEVKRRANAKALAGAAPATAGPSKKRSAAVDPGTALEHIEANSEGMLDIETAAMLMTDLHSKAHEDEAATPYSPDHTTMFDHAAPYLANGVPLPQMPWENFVPHSLSFAAGTSALPPNPHLAMIDQYTTSDGLAPMDHTMVASGANTPNGRGLSPFPFLLGPVSPVDYRRSPGPSQVLTAPKAPQIATDEDFHSLTGKMDQDDVVQNLQLSIDLQSRVEVNNSLSAYFNLYHHHLPFLHPESFQPMEVSTPLLLGVLSIGALYRFDHDQASKLHSWSKLLVNEYVYSREDFSSRKCPLWAMQTTLLNMIFASWSGDATGIEWACSIRGLLANNLVGSKYELKIRTESRGDAVPTHHEWVEDEACRRTYYAVYVFSSLLTMTYNYTPAISFPEFEDLNLPSSETLWNLPVSDDETWRDSYASSIIITAREAHGNLFNSQATRYSAFATRIMIAAISLEVWNHQRQYESLQDVLTEFRLRQAVEAWVASLAFCEPETIIVQLDAPHKGHPLIFNSMAVYRNLLARLEVDLKTTQEALRYHNPYEVANQMIKARDLVGRSAAMTQVIGQCYECLEIVVLEGLKSPDQSCATNWSIEHPLCSFDLIAILTLWLYRYESEGLYRLDAADAADANHRERADAERDETSAELAVYTKLQNLLDEYTSPQSLRLSSVVARIWADMLNHVTVWGITKTMGTTFMLHSEALSGDLDVDGDDSEHSSVSTPSMSSRITSGLDLQTAVY